MRWVFISTTALHCAEYYLISSSQWFCTVSSHFLIRWILTKNGQTLQTLISALPSQDNNKNLLPCRVLVRIQIMSMNRFTESPSHDSFFRKKKKYILICFLPSSLLIIFYRRLYFRISSTTLRIQRAGKMKRELSKSSLNAVLPL